MHIGLTYDLREDYLARGWSEQAVAEFDRADTVDAIAGVLSAQGHTTDRIGGVLDLTERLARGIQGIRGDRWELVFNIAESFGGVGREALVPALLDAHAIPYTFGDPLACCVTLDKPTAKRLLRDAGLPTPDFAVVEREADAARVSLGWPLFCKPAREGSSKGVAEDSVSRTPDELRHACARRLAEFAQPVLVERLLPGREVTVPLLGPTDEPEVIGVLEVSLRDPGAGCGAGRGAVYSYEVKERCEELVNYSLARDEFARECAALARRAYRVLGCRDAGRVDLRADEHGRPSVIEVNALPGMHPSHSDLPITATLAGMDYATVIARIVDSARQRISVTPPSHAMGR
ncbi:MAG TPA: D-alanine--D-alanine ligase [Phycisphaerales bacterium]|nr:D-alanine--D-alanine ligase [Phycisphaerales bacterium]